MQGKGKVELDKAFSEQSKLTDFKNRNFSFFQLMDSID